MSRPRNPTGRIKEPKAVTRKLEVTYCVCDIETRDGYITKDTVIDVLGFYCDKLKLQRYINNRYDYKRSKVTVKSIYHKVYFLKMDINKFIKYAKKIKEIKKEI